MFSKKIATIATLSIASVLALGTVASVRAQMTQVKPTDDAMAKEERGGGCLCSNPVNITTRKNQGATNGYKPDFGPGIRMNQMTYDDKRVDLHFTDTIQWKLPTKNCETTAKATWTVKNNGGNGLQSNDQTYLFLNGKILVQNNIGAMNTGATKTYTYTFKPAEAKEGRASLYTQDDTAVIDFKVEVRGCCITPN
jgi:hypothetical protein